MNPWDVWRDDTAEWRRLSRAKPTARGVRGTASGHSPVDPKQQVQAIFRHREPADTDREYRRELLDPVFEAPLSL